MKSTWPTGRASPYTASAAHRGAASNFPKSVVTVARPKAPDPTGYPSPPTPPMPNTLVDTATGSDEFVNPPKPRRFFVIGSQGEESELQT